jgi:general stress protein CsbA
VMLLRPILFALSIAAAVIAGEETSSFWIGLLAFFIASGCARVIRRTLRGRSRAAVRAFLWPVAATGFVILFAEIGLPKWAAAILAFVCAGVAKNMVVAMFLPRHVLLRAEEWGIPGRDDVIEGRWSVKSGERD